MSNRLTKIATRQRESLLRDAVFAALLTIAAVVSVSSVATAAQAASPGVELAQR